MVQATDGNWYAYLADLQNAQNADDLAVTAGTSLDFGSGCTAASASSAAVSGSLSFTDTEGVFFPGTIATGGSNPLGACATTANNAPLISNVVRENKTLTRPNAGLGILTGQIIPATFGSNIFPFIQLYDFTAGGDAKIVYNIGGGSPQTVTLEFDDALDDWATLSTDRASYPQGADVHVTISDNFLNVDPTDEDSWTFGSNSTNSTTVYQAFDENGLADGAAVANGTPDLQGNLTTIDAGDLGVLLINYNPNNAAVDGILNLFDNDDQVLVQGVNASQAFVNAAGPANYLGQGSAPVTVVETEASSAIFQNTDESDDANIRVATDAPRGTTATIDYNDSAKSILVSQFFGTIDMDATALGGEWNSGEELSVLLTDQDVNLNSRVDEDISVADGRFTIIPAMRIGSPITLAGGTANFTDNTPLTFVFFNTTAVDLFSDVLRAEVDTEGALVAGTTPFLNFTLASTGDDIQTFASPGATASKYTFFNYDIRSLADNLQNEPFTIRVHNATANNAAVVLAAGTNDYQGLIPVTTPTSIPAVQLGRTIGGAEAAEVSFGFTALNAGSGLNATSYPFVVDFFNFGTTGDGNLVSERFNNAIYRFELEETGDNTGQFEGSVEYIMLNQLNVNQTLTYTTGIDPITDAPEIIVHEDLTDEDSPRINYRDVGADGVATQIADQQEAPTHSGIVSFDSSSYKVADTVTVSLEDQDLNVDVETVGIFSVVRTPVSDRAYDQAGTAGYGVNSAGEPFGRLLDITFDDAKWTNNPVAGGLLCVPVSGDNGLGATGFTLVETAAASGIFKGDFQVPADYCVDDPDGTVAVANDAVSTTGVDMEVNYVDFRDASGEIIEVGDGAGIRANTGSVSLDRTVYPVPWGQVADVGGSTAVIGSGGFSVFPIHATGVSINDDAPAGDTDGIVNDDTDTLGNGDVAVHIRVNDPDFDVSAAGEDTIALDNALGVGPVKITVSRGSDSVILGYAGGATPTVDGVIDQGAKATTFAAINSAITPIRQFGAINEIAPDAGIFELDLTLRYTDGPASDTCPTTTSWLGGQNTTRKLSSDVRFDTVGGDTSTFCILQGDIITVEYTDPTDASGDPNTVTDSATFDLRNGVLQSDKSVYIIGADMIMTVIEPDWDRDNDGAETYDLDAIEWDSDAATVTMGNAGGEGVAFDPEPSDLRETGDSTGIFQVVI
jgi:hypothetical protein